MVYKTYAQLKTIIEEENDLEQEIFIQATELLEYFNRGIKMAEAAIHKLGLEDEYFKTSAPLALVTGASDIDLPENIYASKILEIVYESGNTIFEIKRIRGRDKLVYKKILNQTSVGSPPIYRYDLKNDSADDGIQIELVPDSLETSASNVTIEYIREANILEDDDSVCDIPEFYTFLLAFVRWKVRDKEGHPGSEDAKLDYEAEKSLMIETLSGQVPDGETSVEGDMSVYEEMS